MRIGLGIITCERPEYFARVASAVSEHVVPVVDEVIAYQDGGEPYNLPPTDSSKWWTFGKTENHGVAHAFNQCLQSMLATECDWLFLSTDDILPRSPLAITGYLDACRRSGWEHLSFHAHGTFNRKPLGTDHTGAVTLWPEYTGSWSIYSRRSIETCGLMDEQFVNALEHVEHTARLAQHGFTPMPTRQARNVGDATGSEGWLSEIPGSVEASVIRARPDATANVDAAIEHWRTSAPETFKSVFGA